MSSEQQETQDQTQDSFPPRHGPLHEDGRGPCTQGTQGGDTETQIGNTERRHRDTERGHREIKVGKGDGYINSPITLQSFGRRFYPKRRTISEFNIGRKTTDHWKL